VHYKEKWENANENMTKREIYAIVLIYLILMRYSPSYSILPLQTDLSKEGIAIDKAETQKYNPIIKNIISNLMHHYRWVVPKIIIMDVEWYGVIPMRGNILGIPRWLLQLAHTESELAFVICHELMHYQRRDYTKTSYRIPRNIGELDNMDIYNTELCADIGWAQLYVRSGYPKSAILTLLEKIEQTNIHLSSLASEQLFEKRKLILTSIASR
jgi:hypothetical protein